MGGGINGAGVLRDAALRGLRAVLFEKDDFASGASGRSSKLIHGGLRYLETYEFKLVFEACRERHVLLEQAPQLVRPLQFLYPVYRGHQHGLMAASAGVWLYDFLALFRNIRHPRVRLRGSTLKLEPSLRPKGLVGSVSYFDAVTHDTYLTLANFRHARETGAHAFNHAEVTGLLEQGGSVVGVRVKDGLSGRTFRVRARWTVNLTGPWGDRFLAAAVAGRKPLLRVTKGVHLVVPGTRLAIGRAVLMIAPQDGRVTFLIPWENTVLVGTTDSDFEGDPSHARATREDVAYLLEAANYYFPQAKLVADDVISTFAGVRPLLADPHRDPSQLSREHRIVWERPGLVTMAGGKLTTFRKMARQLLDGLVERTPEWRGQTVSCATEHVGLFHPHRETSASFGAAARGWLSEEPMLSLPDLLDRRLDMLQLEPDHGLAHLDEATAILSRHYGFSSAEMGRQREEYLDLVKRSLAGLNRQLPGGPL
ncbi:MAG: glycerol-3-phosphate dehydrogenase/oxidase [Pseudomonadota bacterium]